jgi:mannose-6-phosphate isomerase-like protein (cupin superfamily)
MNYKLIKNEDIEKKEKLGLNLSVFPNVGDCGVVLENTEEGHNSEFYNTKSTFTYIVLDGNGSFFLNDEELLVAKGDCLSISPNTRIYFRGKLKMILITNPAWRQEDEVKTKNKIW